ncbi:MULTISPECIES: hypothetical protein [Mycolicibacterium]|nr:hypothetical protein [Mycolicibacterium vanbaalenii]
MYAVLWRLGVLDIED